MIIVSICEQVNVRNVPSDRDKKSNLTIDVVSHIFFSISVARVIQFRNTHKSKRKKLAKHNYLHDYFQKYTFFLLRHREI